MSRSFLLCSIAMLGSMDSIVLAIDHQSERDPIPINADCPTDGDNPVQGHSGKSESTETTPSDSAQEIQPLNWNIMNSKGATGVNQVIVNANGFSEWTFRDNAGEPYRNDSTIWVKLPPVSLNKQIRISMEWLTVSSNENWRDGCSEARDGSTEMAPFIRTVCIINA